MRSTWKMERIFHIVVLVLEVFKSAMLLLLIMILS